MTATQWTVYNFSYYLYANCSIQHSDDTHHYRSFFRLSLSQPFSRRFNPLTHPTNMFVIPSRTLVDCTSNRQTHRLATRHPKGRLRPCYQFIHRLILVRGSEHGVALGSRRPK